jgi:4-amino-4-deoxy-L-arabinose transferase-like glycosyltransferase
VSSPALDQEVADSPARIRPRRALATWVASLAARGGFPVLAFSALYVASTSVLSVRRPLWNDELYTYYFARVPSVADLWRALETGADQAPPVTYLFTRASFSVLGVSSFSIRLPELIAFLVFCSCAYLFVARRTNQLYGLIAMLLPTVTVADYYASEARAYALVLAFGALALVCWQLATEGVRRRPALVGLAVALCLATSSHYYAVLLLVPLCLGELARTLAARRLDVWVWVAFLGALVPFVAFIRLVRASHGYSAGFWGRPSWDDSLRFFSFLLDTRSEAGGVQLGQVGRPTEWWLALLAVLVLAAALVALSPAVQWLQSRRKARNMLFAAVVCLALVGPAAVELKPALPVSLLGGAIVGVALLVLGAYFVLKTSSQTPLLPGPPAHEVVAAGAFLLVPLAGVVVAKTVTNAYTDRYALPAVIGLVVLPLALYRLEGRRPLFGASVVAVLAGAFVVMSVLQEQNASRLSADRHRTLQFLERSSGGRLPILIDNPHQFLELSDAAPKSLARRLFYVADPNWDSTQRGLVALGRIASLRVYDRSGDAALPDRLLAFSAGREADWSDTRYWTVLRLLRAEGRTIRRKAVFGERALYEISASA